MEKDFLQSIKLEISRNFSLSAYERIAFHKILNISKSSNGAEVLLRDTSKPGAIRLSALSTLSQFSYTKASATIIEILKNSEKSDELGKVFEYIENNGTPDFIPELITFIKQRSVNIFNLEINRALFLVGKLTKEIDITAEESPVETSPEDDENENRPKTGNELYTEYTNYLVKTALSNETPQRLRATAIAALDHYIELPFYQSILEEYNDLLNSAAFRTIASLAHREMKIYQDQNQRDMFTHVPPAEDMFMLNIRVLLSTFSSNFDTFSNETKVAFIQALFASNHREYIVFVMKTLTSGDTNLIDMTLYVILASIQYLNNPDKLFRNMISLPSLTDRDDQIIVETFIKYFKNLQINRTNNLIRDKLFNYIIVMLDKFFENYRENYIVPEIRERDYIDEFQIVRKFILEHLDPHLKRRIIKFLTTEDIELKTLIIEISEKVTFIHTKDEKALAILLEILHDQDKKAREISAQRLNDIDFEKKYLKFRIIRLCNIIGQLQIRDAQNSLGKMFDYIKRFYDEDLFHAVSYSLSQLNYPYMLGELEYLFLNEDANTTKIQILHFLAQFSEQRAIIIMLDFLKTRFTDVEPIVHQVLQVLFQKDVKSDKSVNEFSKVINEKNRSPEIRAAAIHLIGKTGFEKDILYLHELFIESQENVVKEAVVQALDFIVTQNPSMRKKDIAPQLKGYLKDPSIRVRIFSCLILLQMGDIGALSILKDMMIIRNKDIQREILLILGSYMTIELSFFLLSLLNEDYSISEDIIPLFYYLAPEDKIEIDHFIVNIFKKHEGTRIEIDQQSNIESNQKYVEQLNSFQYKTSTILYIKIFQYENFLTRYQSTELAIFIKSTILKILAIITENEGTISSVTGGQIVAFFNTTPESAMCALELIDLEEQINYTIAEEEKLQLMVYVENANLCINNNEILLHNTFNFSKALSTGLINRVFLNRKTADAVNLAFQCENYPDTPFALSGMDIQLRELINSLNFVALVDEMLARIRRQTKEKVDRDRELSKSSVKHKIYLSKEAIHISDSINELGKILKRDLNEILVYVKKRSTDRELIKQVDKMLDDTHKRFKLEKNKIEIE